MFTNGFWRGEGKGQSINFFYFNHFPSQFPPPPLCYCHLMSMSMTHGFHCKNVSLLTMVGLIPCFFFEWIFMHSHWSLQMLFLSMAETWKKLHTVWTKHALLTLLTDMSIANVPSTSCELIKFKKLRKHVDYSLGWVSKLSNHKSPFSAH